jgi:hypothetical protein
MIVLGVLSFIIGGINFSQPVSSDSVPLRVPGIDSVPVNATSRILNDTTLAGAGAPADTIRPRRRAVEVSEWYSRRLTIHRYVAYGTIPVFALQYAAGSQIFTKGSEAPRWAKNTHRAGATTLAAMFTVNTVTGAWNWWDSRSASQGRVLRTFHALTMIGADAAFTYAGVKLSDQAENSEDKRRQHRTVALASIGVTVASGLMMKLLNR